jgi:hypothetical protein
MSNTQGYAQWFCSRRDAHGNPPPHTHTCARHTRCFNSWPTIPTASTSQHQAATRTPAPTTQFMLNHAHLSYNHAQLLMLCTLAADIIVRAGPWRACPAVCCHISPLTRQALVAQSRDSCAAVCLSPTTLHSSRSPGGLTKAVACCMLEAIKPDKRNPRCSKQRPPLPAACSQLPSTLWPTNPWKCQYTCNPNTGMQHQHEATTCAALLHHRQQHLQHRLCRCAPHPTLHASSLPVTVCCKCSK